MDNMKNFRLKENIVISLGGDMFIRVIRKHPENRFAVEPLYIITKVQGIVLSLFEKPCSIYNASQMLSTIFQVKLCESEKKIEEVLQRFTGILEECALEEKIIQNYNIEKIKQLLQVNIKKPKEITTINHRLEKPKTLVVFITNSCLCDCIYCRVDAGCQLEKSQFIEIDIIEKIAWNCEKYGIKDVELTGGDPMLHPKIEEIVRIFSSHNVPVSFSTKCPISNERMNSFINSNINVLQFSLDSINEMIFSELTRTSKKYFKQLYDSILNAVQLKIEVQIKSVITSININYIPEMIRLLYSKGIKKYVLQALNQGDRSYSTDLIALPESYLQLEEEISILEKELKGISIKRAYSIDYILTKDEQKKYFRQDCMAGKTGIVIQVDGSYSYCGQSINKDLMFLNIKDTDLLDAWNSKQLNSLLYPKRSQFEGTKCYNCDDFDYCAPKRCYIRSYNKWGQIYNVDPLCPHYVEEG